MNSNKKIVSFEIDMKMLDKLKELADTNYRSLSAQLRMIIQQYLEKQDV